MDETSKSLGQSTKLLLAAATQLAVIIAARRREALREAAALSDETARQVQKLQAAEHQAVKPLIAKAQGNLENLSPEELADSYQACRTWEDVDPEAMRGAQTIESHLDERDPSWRQASDNRQAQPTIEGKEVINEPQATSREAELRDRQPEDQTQPRTDQARRPDPERRRSHPTSKAGDAATVTAAALGKRAAVEAWAKDQLQTGADPDHVRGMKLAALVQPTDPTKRSTIGLRDDDDPTSLNSTSSLTL